MRAFIVMCLVAVATAQYNYQPNTGLGSIGSASGGEPSFAAPSGGSFGGAPSGGSFGGAPSGGSFGGAPSGGSFGGAPSGGSFGGAAPSGGSFGSNSGIGGPADDGLFSAPSNTASQTAPSGELNKQFYTYTANDAEFAAPAGSEQASNYLKQGLKVIFIKGPESSGLEDAALALAKNAADDNTAIYVLNKQTDLASLAEKLNALRAESSNKPEVHFVKYRTPEDAANAQKQIQSQYDGLGGNSETIDGGVAPSINFASQAPVKQQAAASAPANAYLPTNIFRHRLIRF